jgi:hypothetical protein
MFKVKLNSDTMFVGDSDALASLLDLCRRSAEAKYEESNNDDDERGITIQVTTDC